MGRPHLIITSIQAPNAVMRAFAEQCGPEGFDFVVVGDTKSPKDFALEGCRFMGVDDRRAQEFAFARACPTAHYARKNIGYLAAMAEDAELIVETDDDNFPMPSFFAPRRREHAVPCLDSGGWTNVYGYYSDAPIWPRGLPLNHVRRKTKPLASLPVREADCPIQQGLADANPDVDAIYRLTLPLPQHFRPDLAIALGAETWCPFNSQNTAWWPDAYMLLYLPAYCSFRMTDIWRSFVAQRIAWSNGWHILFHAATVIQDRNDHNLMRDFEQELPGYLGNEEIGHVLTPLPIARGLDAIGDNLLICYRALVDRGFVAADEITLLSHWIDDCRRVLSR